jgi:hypothetical protein
MEKTMGKIAVHQVEEIQWKKIRDMAAPRQYQRSDGR